MLRLAVAASLVLVSSVARAADPPGTVAVKIDSDEPNARYELLDEDGETSFGTCLGGCTLHVWPGRYRLHALESTDTAEGARTLRIESSVHVFVAPRSHAMRWVGLGVGLSGLGLIGVGGAFIAQTRFDNLTGRAQGSTLDTGVALVLFGARRASRLSSTMSWPSMCTLPLVAPRKPARPGLPRAGHPSETKRQSSVFRLSGKVPAGRAVQ